MLPYSIHGSYGYVCFLLFLFLYTWRLVFGASPVPPRQEHNCSDQSTMLHTLLYDRAMQFDKTWDSYEASRVCLDCYFAVWMFIHRLGFWWFWWFWMLPGCRFQTSWDHLVPSTAVFLMLPKGPRLLTFYPGWWVDPLDILHFTQQSRPQLPIYPLEVRVARQEHLQLGLKVLDHGGAVVRVWDILGGKTNPTQVWKHPQIDHLLYFPQTHSFIPNSTDCYVSISLGMALFVFCRAEPEQNRTAGTQPWNLLFFKSWVRYNLYIYIYIIYYVEV